ncbi:MAG: 30S ribosomal protein S24e [Candidatus Thorarchaeota archaeon]
MEIQIQEERYNPLVERKEVSVIITHLGEMTPTREAVRAKVAAQLNIDLERVVIQSMQGHFGKPISSVVVHCYDKAQNAMEFEARYRLVRNKIVEPKPKG